MNKAGASLLFFVLTACSQQPESPKPATTQIAEAPLQCAKDTDCKGDRICDNGTCVNPQSPSIGPENPVAAAVAVPVPAQGTGNPKYKDYPVTLYTGPAAKLLLDSDFAKEYRSRLNEALADAPVFAGEYVATGWGCGSGGCYVTAFVSKRTGKALEQTFSAYSASDESGGTEERIGEEPEALKLDSRLLVTQEVTEDENTGARSYFANFYVVEDGELKRIKHTPIPKPVTDTGT